MSQQWTVRPRFALTGVALAIALLLALIAILDDAVPQAGSGGATASAGADTWQTYYTDSGEFEVDLPDEPRLSSVVGPASVIEGAPGVSLVSVADMVTYDVLVYELGDPATAAAASAVLNDALERSIRARLEPGLQVTQATLGDSPATQYRFSLAADTTTLIRLGAVGSQIVQLTVAVDRGGDAAEAERFFDSWQPEPSAEDSP